MVSMSLYLSGNLTLNTWNHKHSETPRTSIKTSFKIGSPSQRPASMIFWRRDSSLTDRKWCLKSCLCSVKSVLQLTWIPLHGYLGWVWNLTAFTYWYNNLLPLRVLGLVLEIKGQETNIATENGRSFFRVQWVLLEDVFFQERIKLEEKMRKQEMEIDYLAPFLAQIGDPDKISRTQAYKLKEDCLADLKQRLIDKANLIQARFEKVRLTTPCYHWNSVEDLQFEMRNRMFCSCCRWQYYSHSPYLINIRCHSSLSPDNVGQIIICCSRYFKSLVLNLW